MRTLGYRAKSALVALAALLGGCGAQRTELPARVVLITLDTLRYDTYAGPGGAARMPNLHALAQGGWDFDRFFASTSTTQPTHASLLTGLQPWAHGVTRNGLTLADEHTTVAEALRTQGFSTSAVVASFPLHGRFGFAQGFDSYKDDFDVPYVTTWEGEATEQGKFYSLAESITGAALGALDAAQGEQQFFWFHYFDPHDPYGDAGANPDGAAPIGIATLLTLAGRKDPRLGQMLLDARLRYDADVAALDRSLGRLFERLAEDEERFDTHIVITADHGESFGERLSIGHGKRVTREQVQVPLIIASPRVAPERRRDLGTSVDVARTLLSLAGIAAGDFEGRNLLTSDTNETVFGMRRAFAKPKPEVLADGSRRSLSPAWFFCVKGDTLFGGDATEVLQEDDPAHPLTGTESDHLRTAFAELERRLAGQKTAQDGMDDEARRALNALGYSDLGDE